VGETKIGIRGKNIGPFFTRGKGKKLSRGGKKGGRKESVGVLASAGVLESSLCEKKLDENELYILRGTYP